MVVRLEEDKIVEIFPEQFKTVADIQVWYSEDFAKHSMITEQAVEVGMVYNHETGFFKWPDPPPPTSEELLNILMGVDING